MTQLLSSRVPLLGALAYSTHACLWLTHDGIESQHKLISGSEGRNKSSNIPYDDVTRDTGSRVRVSQTLPILDSATLLVHIAYTCVYVNFREHT